MDIIRKCNFCNNQAIADGKTKIGPWAYMCPTCLSIFGYPNSKMNTKLVKDYPSASYKGVNN